MTDNPWHSLLAAWGPTLLGLAGFAAALAATLHVLLTKRNVQARAGWVGVVWLVPFVGSALYLLFGINRIRRRAVALHRRATLPVAPAVVPVTGIELPASLRAINRVINQVTRRPLLPGNRVTVYSDGREACDAMLAAIGAATRSVTLCTYIFDNDRTGHAFIAALKAAHERGVEVRVLVDAVGLRYSWLNPVDPSLRAAGIRYARFLPPRFLPWHMPYANLRNHRKLLVVDGVLGFTGGMNIREGHVLRPEQAGAILDLHFELRGPVVGQLQRSFQEDWLFASGEMLTGGAWFPPAASVEGDTLARGISDGPDEDYDKLFWAYLAGINGAQESLYILTPYFLPEPELVSALNCAAMRGVAVNIVLPESSNLPPVDWASTAILDDLLAHGCRLWLTPPPFDHGKLFLVDDAWALIGSGNWDPRSLRLNFEFSVECYDATLGRRLRYEFERRLAIARELRLGELRARPFLERLRDNLAALFIPYL